MAVDLDLERVAAEVEALLRKLDEAKRQLDDLQRELRATAEERARDWVVENVAPEKRESAERLVHDAMRIADEVGGWLVQRSPVGLLERLVPELRAAAEDAQRFLQAQPPKTSSL